jgi:hypothetical protein
VQFGAICLARKESVQLDRNSVFRGRNNIKINTLWIYGVFSRVHRDGNGIGLRSYRPFQPFSPLAIWVV